ncbi:FadR family transcriptional regulator [Actinomadura barringtoniae]|uniref:FadR family transcriptional regulator n=1 Tax=Actinomadura barringtoniae TaxID=1427535 RepID=A0A939PHA2_9ACTN|nr:FCD domain-containing protein [Actinomadura barringtoniae]MBO2448516.1 FadR family transcriptional regulator [Actinomadura barringtoniae]
MPLGPLRPSPLVEQAALHLREQITSGEWPVGTKLPGETTLAAQLGVGRSTVREAIRALAGAGLLQARQGSGVFVIATEPEEDLQTRLRRASVGDVYEIRMMIEVRAAELAAARRTDEDLAAMDRALAARGEAAGGPDEPFIDADIALHVAVVAAAHNPLLGDLFGEFLPVLREGLLDLVRLIDVPTAEGDHGRAAHTGLVEAIRARDAAGAAATIEEELRRTVAYLKARP